MSEKLDIRLKTFDARPKTFDARLKTFNDRLLNGLPLDDLNTTRVCETGSGVFWLTTFSMADGKSRPSPIGDNDSVAFLGGGVGSETIGTRASSARVMD